jgi:hypothetical protein
LLFARNGRRVPVCGKNFQIALWAVALVDVVVRRGQTIPLPRSRDGGLERARVNGMTLAAFLQNIYGNDPAAVAEAIMALRKFDRKRASWLLHVLGAFPSLASLARLVQIELTGEEKNLDQA